MLRVQPGELLMWESQDDNCGRYGVHCIQQDFFP